MGLRALILIWLALGWGNGPGGGAALTLSEAMLLA